MQSWGADSPTSYTGGPHPRIFPFPWCRCILFLSTSLRVKWNNVSLIDGWQFRTQMSLCSGTEAGPCGCLCSPDARNPILTKQSAPGKSCCNRFGQVFSLCWMFVFLCSGSPPTRFSRDLLPPEVKVSLAPTSVLKVTTVLGLQNPHGRVFLMEGRAGRRPPLTQTPGGLSAGVSRGLGGLTTPGLLANVVGAASQKPVLLHAAPTTSHLFPQRNFSSLGLRQ